MIDFGVQLVDGQTIDMSSRDRKDKLRAIRDAQERAAARARVRHPHEDISYRGAGLRRVQVLRAPSFGTTVAWEVRELDERLTLFRSHSPAPDQYLLVDHVRLAAASDALRRLIAPLQDLSMPLCPSVQAFGVIDGTRIEVAMDAGFSSQIRVKWSEGYAPAEWQNLDRITRAMMAFFETTESAEPEIESGGEPQ
jgi:hypothetical protein